MPWCHIKNICWRISVKKSRVMVPFALKSRIEITLNQLKKSGVQVNPEIQQKLSFASALLKIASFTSSHVSTGRV